MLAQSRERSIVAEVCHASITRSSEYRHAATDCKVDCHSLLGYSGHIGSALQSRGTRQDVS
jgi:hypothetical protein